MSKWEAGSPQTEQPHRLRYVIRDGVKVLQQLFCGVCDKEVEFRDVNFKDIPTEDEEI